MRGQLGARVGSLAAIVLAAILGGCQPATKAGPNGEPPPTYDELAAIHNDRADRLARLWMRTTVRVETRDAADDRHIDQGEGYLQIVQPDRVALSVGRYIDKMYFFLGSNDAFYWWLDMFSDEKIALVGRHALATPQRAAELGVPIHPLELIDLLGITPIPPTGAPPAWGDDGLIHIEVPARWGTRTIAFAPRVYEPRIVELRTASGELAASSELVGSQGVTMRQGGPRPTLPDRVLIDLPLIDSRIIFDLYDPEHSARKPKPAAFDLEGLLRRYRIDEVRSLDPEGAG